MQFFVVLKKLMKSKDHVSKLQYTVGAKSTVWKPEMHSPTLPWSADSQAHIIATSTPVYSVSSDIRTYLFSYVMAWICYFPEIMICDTQLEIYKQNHTMENLSLSRNFKISLLLNEPLFFGHNLWFPAWIVSR